MRAPAHFFASSNSSGIQNSMVSAIDRAKRALVTLVKQMAALYRVTINIDRDSDDVAFQSAYRKVSMKSHPDKGGREEHRPTSHWEDGLQGACQGPFENQDGPECCEEPMGVFEEGLQGSCSQEGCDG